MSNKSKHNSCMSICSAPKSREHVNCFVECTYFQMINGHEFISVRALQSGMELVGPRGVATVERHTPKYEKEYDIVDFKMDSGVMSVTIDHRVVVCGRNGDPQELAAGEVAAEGMLWMGVGKTMPYKAMKSCRTAKVYDVYFKNDALVFIFAPPTPVGVSKGGPGESLHSYGCGYGSDLLGCCLVNQKSRSAPASICEQVDFESFTEVQQKSRRSKDPSLLELLQHFACEAHCTHLLRRAQCKSKCALLLPRQDAVDLEILIQPLLQLWKQKQSAEAGRSSSIAWRHLAATCQE